MDVDATLVRIRAQAAARVVRITDHAREEMEAEAITLAEAAGQIIENYPDHRRGPCCLMSGSTTQGRSLHMVCTTTLLRLVIITVYMPTLPKWISPIERSSK